MWNSLKQGVKKKSVTNLKPKLTKALENVITQAMTVDFVAKDPRRWIYHISNFESIFGYDTHTYTQTNVCK